jgi:putative ABC transport system permease protein
VRVGAGGVALAVTLSVLSGLLLGGISLLRAGRADMAGSIEGAGRTTVGREGLRAQRLLVALQVALALTLLIGSAVMVQSFWRLKAVDLGFRPEQVTTFEISLPFRQYPKFQDAARFQHELLGRLANTPGVTSVGAGVGVPLTPVPEYLVESFTAEDHPAGRGEIPPPASVNLVTPGYFETMGIPILRGRAFGRGDLLGESLPVVLTPASARALFGAEDPVGRRVRLAEMESYPAYTVVGVAGPVPGEKLADGPASMVYFPVTDDLQGDTAAKVPVPFVPREAITVVVRSTLPTATLAPTVRRLVRDLDAKVPIASIRPMGQIVEDATARTRLTTLLLLVAAGAAVLLGIIGIYGIVAYTVGQRTREFGVRLALGATAADVNRLVLRQGVRLTLVGIAAGLLAAFGLTRFMRGLLFEVSPGNPLAFAAMSAALLGVALAATYLPARRAGRIDPAQTLKAE